MPFSIGALSREARSDVVRAVFVVSSICLASLAAGPGDEKGPKCGDAYRYRWLQKTDASLASQTASPVGLSEANSTWAAAQLQANGSSMRKRRDQVASGAGIRGTAGHS